MNALYVGRDSWGLKQHMLIHTGKKPHECDVHIWEQICGVKQSEPTCDDTYRREAS